MKEREGEGEKMGRMGSEAWASSALCILHDGCLGVLFILLVAP